MVRRLAVPCTNPYAAFSFLQVFMVLYYLYEPIHQTLSKEPSVAETIASILLNQLGQHPAFATQIWKTGILLGRPTPDKQLKHFDRLLGDADRSDEGNVRGALADRPNWQESLDVRIDVLRSVQGLPCLTDSNSASIPLRDYAQACCDVCMSQLQAILPLVEGGVYWGLVDGELRVSKPGAERTLRMYALMAPSTH
jgi:hypothetical protein